MDWVDYPIQIMKKPPEGGFSITWWPGAESNRGRESLIHKNLI